MARLKKSKPTSEVLTQAFEQTLNTFLLHKSANTPASSPTGGKVLAETKNTRATLAIAYSGGRDSSVLLHIAARYRTRINLLALHIHHGLSPHADAWLEHCEQQAQQLGIAFFAQKIQLTQTRAESLEAAARHGRYQALEQLCITHGATIVCTAHHANDQAETVLLNLLRGSGNAGLAGIAAFKALGTVTLARPFLAIGQTVLSNYAQAQHLAFIQDESNANPRFMRNALRLQVMPLLEQIAPALNQQLAKTARLAGQTQDLCNQIGQDDLRACCDDLAGLIIARLKQLSPARAANVLRVWLQAQNLYPPSLARLQEILKQISAASANGALTIKHQQQLLRIQQGRLIACPTAPRGHAKPTIEIRWTGQARIEIPEWQGALHFCAASDDGIDANWLGSQILILRPRQGGERLKIHAQRPSRTLKNLYQERAIPVWQRECLPLLYAGSQLIMVGGVGIDTRCLKQRAETSDALIALEWQAVKQEELVAKATSPDLER